MPFYDVTLSDGTEARVESDHDPSEQEVLDILSRQQQPQAQFFQEKPVTPKLDFWEERLAQPGNPPVSDVLRHPVRYVGAGAGLLSKGALGLVGRIAGTGDTALDVGKAVFMNEPLPVEKSVEEMPSGLRRIGARIGLGLAETAPKIGLLALAPQTLPAQMAAAGGIFGLDAQGKFHPVEAAIGALMPGVGRLAQEAAARGLAKSLEKGIGPTSRFGQKIFETVGEQVGFNAYMLAAESPSIIELYRQDPTKARDMVAEIVGQNLAWSLLGIRKFRGKIPSATQDLIFRNGDKYAKQWEKMFSDSLTLPLEQRRAFMEDQWRRFTGQKPPQVEGLGEPFRQSVEDVFGAAPPGERVATGRTLIPQGQIPGEPYVPPEPGPLGEIPPYQPPPPEPPSGGAAVPIPPSPATIEREAQNAVITREQQRSDLIEHQGVPRGQNVPPYAGEVRQGEGELTGSRGGVVGGETIPPQAEAPRPPVDWNAELRDTIAEIQRKLEIEDAVGEVRRRITMREGEQPPAFPSLRDMLPSTAGMTAEQRKARYDQSHEIHRQWERDLADWESQQPMNRPIIFEHDNLVSAITPNIGGGWRTTNISRTDRMPTGHEVYKTRLEALREQVVGGGGKRVRQIGFEVVPLPERMFPGDDVIWRAPNGEEVRVNFRGFLGGEQAGQAAIFNKDTGVQLTVDAMQLHPIKNIREQNIPPLPEAAKSGTLPETAGTETTGTVRSTSEAAPQGAGTRSTEAGNAAEMTAEAGEIPARPPAVVRSEISTLRKAQKKLLERAQKLGRIGENAAAQNAEHKAGQLAEQITVLRGELSRAESERTGKPRKINLNGITEADGLLLDIVGAVGKLPIFMPPGWMVAKIKKYRARMKAGDLLRAKERDEFRSLMERYPENYEDDFGVDGAQMKAAYKAAKEAGIAAELFAVTEDGRHLHLDNILDSIRDRTGKEYSAVELYRIVEGLARAKKQRDTQGEAEELPPEAEHAKEQVQQDQRFFRDTTRNTPGTLPLTEADIIEGARFTLKGARVRVTRVERDLDGNITEVELDDGKRYGTQIVDGRLALRLRADENSLKLPKVAQAEESVEFLTREDQAAAEPPIAEVSPKPELPSGTAIEEGVQPETPVAAEPAPVAGVPTGGTEPPAAPAKPAGPAVDLFGNPIEEPKAPEVLAGPVERQDMLGLAAEPGVPAQPGVQERPLTEAEKAEFRRLAIKARDARDSGGEQLTTEETQRYEYLSALAGQKTFGFQAPEGKDAMKAQLIELSRRHSALLDKQPQGRGKRWEEWRNQVQAIDREMRRLRTELTEGEGTLIFETQPPEEMPSGYFGTRRFRVRKLSSEEVNIRWPTPDARMQIIREYGTLENLWTAESQRMEYEDAFGKTLAEKGEWYADGYGNSPESAIAEAKERQRKDWNRVPADALQKAQQPKEGEQPHGKEEGQEGLQEVAPKTPEAQGTAQPAPAAGAAIGTEVNGYRKTEKGWQKLDEDGRIKKTSKGRELPPANAAISANLEKYAANPPPAETRSNAEILSQAADVRVALKNATAIRVTFVNERTGESNSRVFTQSQIKNSFEKGNTWQGQRITNVEAGMIGSKDQFIPQGSVTVLDAGRRQAMLPNHPSAMDYIDDFYRNNPKGKEQLDRHLEVGDDIKKIIDDEGWIMASNALSHNPTDPVQYFKWRAENYGYPEEFQAAVLRISRAFDKFQPSPEVRAKVEAWVDEKIGKARTKEDYMRELSQSLPVMMNGQNVMLTFPDVGMPRNLLPAYHGTPHEVDRFKTEKIGTGEGAQVYGWGLYFGERKEVGEEYARRLGSNSIGLFDKQQFDPYNPRHQAAVLLEQSHGSREYAIAEAGRVQAEWGASPHRETFAKAAEVLRNHEEAKITRGGNLYTVDLDVKPEELLDWDKPLNQMPQRVRELLLETAKEIAERDKIYPADVTGEQIYQRLVDSKTPRPTEPGGAGWGDLQYGHLGPRKASEYLASLGIKGIRYLDQGSRNAERENWTRFSESDANEAADQMRREGYTDVKVERWQDPRKGQWGEIDERWYVRGTQPQTYNYVIFDENVIRITDVNGKSVTMDEARKAMLAASEAAKEPSRRAVVMGESIPLNTTADIRRVVEDPKANINADHRKFFQWLLDRGWMDKYPGLRMEIADYVAGQAVAEHIGGPQGTGFARFLRWTDSEAPLHEFMHHIERFLGPEDRQWLSEMRQQYIDEQAPQMRDTLGKGMASDEFVKAGISRDLYHLANDSEFFAWLMTEKGLREMNRPEASTFVARVREFIADLWKGIKAAFGLQPYEETLWQQILNGKLPYAPEEGIKFGQRQAMLVRTPKEFELREALGEEGHRAAVVGGYAERVRTIDRVAAALGISDRAKTLLKTETHRDILSQAEPLTAARSYTEAKDTAPTEGQKSEVMRDAFESIEDFQFQGNQLLKRRNQLTEEIRDPKFRGLLTRTAEKQDRAEMLAEIKRTFLLQTAAAAGRITNMLERQRIIGTAYEQLQADLERVRRLPDYSNAVAQTVDRIVNTVAVDDVGISVLAAGGSRDGRDILNEYFRHTLAAGEALPSGDSHALLELSAAVLAANRDLRNSLTSLAILSRDISMQTEVNQAGRRIASEIINNPAKAIPRLATRVANMADKAARAEMLWLALHRKVQKKLDLWNKYDEAVRLHQAVSNDAEWQAHVNEVNRDVGGLHVPDEIRATMPSGKPQPFFELKGHQTLYAPNGQAYPIRMDWTPQTVHEAQDRLVMLKSQITDWLDDPLNTNSPARKYWEERQTLIENVLMSSAVWNPTAIIPPHLGRLGMGSFGIPETFYQGLALPDAKLAYRAQKGFDIYWTQAKGWFSKNWAETERLLEHALGSHKYNEKERKDYQIAILNAIAWAYRHGREVRAGDVLHGYRITPADMALFFREGRDMREAYDLVQRARNLAGAEKVSELPRVVAEFPGGAWGIRKAMELGVRKGTTLSRTFSYHGANLANAIHDIISKRDAALTELGKIAHTLPEAEVAQRRGWVADDYFKEMATYLNDPGRYQNFVVSFLEDRSSDWLKKYGVSPFEEHYREMKALRNANDPDVPQTLEQTIGWLADRVSGDWTPEEVRDQFLKEITSLTEDFHKVTGDPETRAGVTIIVNSKDTAFNTAWSADMGPAYFYDYGWTDAGDMRRISTDMASFGWDRMMASMAALEDTMEKAIKDLTGSVPGWRKEQIRLATLGYKTGKDFRDLQHLEDKLTELRRFMNGMRRWMGVEAVHAEGIQLRAGARPMSAAVQAALTGLRTAGRISGISMGGSAWKMGNVFSQLGYGKFRSYPLSAVSAIMSLARLNTATAFGWYHPGKGFVPGVPLRIAMNIPKAIKAGVKAKGPERFYSALEKALENTTDEQFAALRYWFDQKELGMTPNNPVGAKVAADLRASRTRGGIFTRGNDYPQSVLGEAWQIGKLAVSKPWAAGEAALDWVGSYLPQAFGYNITYDAVGRQAGWYIDMLSAQARRTFETYEKLGQLGRFDFNRLNDPRNTLTPWEVLPSFVGKMTFVNPKHLPAWARPNSTNLAFARELFHTSTSYDLQDLVLRYFKRLAATPKEQRGDVEFMAPDIADPVEARKIAENRARGIISRFVEQTHHAAPSNRPWWLQKNTQFQFILPFLGWSAQTIKQNQFYMGKAAYSVERDGKPVDTRTGLIVAAALTALGMASFAFLGGDFEVRFLRWLDRLVHHKESQLKTIDEAKDGKEAAEIAVHNMTAGIPLLNSTLNTLLGSTGYRGTYGFQAFGFDKINALFNYLRGVYRTKDMTYGLERLAETNIPITETIIENLFQRQGFQNSRNAVRALQKFGPEEMVERRASASISLPTELTPYRMALQEAVFSGRTDLVQKAAQAFVEKAREIGRPDPEKTLAQTFSTLNPYRQAFGGLPTEEERRNAVNRMDDFQRQVVLDAERNYSKAAGILGFTSNFTKDEYGNAPSVAAGGGTAPSMVRTAGLTPRRITLGGATRRIGIAGVGTPRGFGRRLGRSARTGLRRLGGRSRLVTGRLKLRSGRIRRLGSVRRPGTRRITLV